MIVFSVFLASSLILASDVRISGKRFKLNGERIFLSGANQPWFWYDYDFGDGQWFKDPKGKIFIIIKCFIKKNWLTPIL